jgi:hypothetical protein
LARLARSGTFSVVGRVLFIAAALLVAIVPCASARTSAKTGFAFGRDGGNIQPFAVVISVHGDVQTSGPVEAHRRTLTRLQLAELNRLAVTTGFTHLTQRTNCPGTLPDVAATYIRVGARTIHVHGDCVVSYKKLWTALQHAAQVRF